MYFIVACLLFSIICNAEYSWKKHPKSSKECVNCGESTNYLCGFDIGAVPSVNKSNVKENDVCIRFHSTNKLTTRFDVYKKLGTNAFINFVGDSNTRMLFVEALNYFGHPDWFKNLHNLAKNWKNKNTRHTVDHTYLCTGPLPPSNITLSFLWFPFNHDIKFHSRRPWSRCQGKIGPCASDTGITICDGSDPEGIDARWACGSMLDQVQFEGSNRSFIVISQGGVHDVLHTYHAQHKNINDANLWTDIKSKIDNNYAYLKNELNEEIDIRYPGILAEYKSRQKKSKCWSSVPFGGREILVSPLHVRRADCHQCAGTANTQPGTDKALGMMREAMLNTQGLIGEVYQDFVDAYSISSEESQAPWSVYDGVHYPAVMYRAELELIMSKIVYEDQPIPPKTEDDETAYLNAEEEYYKKLYLQSLKEMEGIKKSFSEKSSSSTSTTTSNILSLSSKQSNIENQSAKSIQNNKGDSISEKLNDNKKTIETPPSDGFQEHYSPEN